MSEKRQKKELYHEFLVFGFSPDEAKKMAYNVLTLGKDLKEYDKQLAKEIKDQP